MSTQTNNTRLRHEILTNNDYNAFGTMGLDVERIGGMAWVGLT